MRYVKNATSSNVRVATRITKTAGGHVHDSVELEPEVVVESINPKTRVRSTRPGKNVGAVEDDSFNRPEFKNSLGILIQEISEEEYDERQTEIVRLTHSGGTKEIKLAGFKSADHEMTLNTDTPVAEEAITRIPMDKETLEMSFAGAEHGTNSRPDEAEGGKTLTEVRRSKDAEGIQVDPDILRKMGK